ncbi:MAG TPA: RNA-binding protein [Rhizomicrobium sp.]|nr:RNA-binding protein [Rhizomicrobium sp.]
MTAAADEMTREKDAHARERRCIVTGEILPDDKRVRFVVGPDDRIVPDIEETLPGRGIWVKAEAAAIEKAVAKNLFSRAAKAEVAADADLPARVEMLLAKRMMGDLGLARKSGALVLGFDNVLRALSDKVPPAVLIEASDGSHEGRRKLKNAALNQGVKAHLVDCLSAAELALALGRENVIHASVKPGRLAERLILEAARLEGFRPAGRSGFGPKAPKKGQE